MTGPSTQLRLDAVARLGEIAGYPTLNLDLTLSRTDSVQVLCRQALRAAVGDELLIDEVRRLAPLVGGRAWVLDDAVLEGGHLPARTPERLPSGAPATGDIDLHALLTEEGLLDVPTP